MYLKSLEMQGFKSFPDKTKLEFGKGMTAVVGPNGSGKSNIADAVKWVLGEQSSKSLRGSKMEDVVFSGTRERRAQGFAEVTLRLDNSDRQLSVDSDEVAVTRRFYRSGESEYRINGSSVRLMDINELFMDTGLGRDGYSMVSQGRIEDIVSAKSEDRREMLEEAAGISRFRYRRSEAMKRFDRAEENLLRLRDILTGLEERVGPLEKQSEKAQKFLVLADERKTLEIGLWLDILESSDNLIREQNNRYTVAEVHYQQTEKELEELIKASEEAAKSVSEVNVQIDEIRRQASGYEDEIASVESLIAVNRNSIAHNKENEERIEREKARENMSSNQIGEQIQAAQEAISALEKLIEEKRESIGMLSKELNELRLKDSDVSDEYVKISDIINELTLKLSAEKIKLTSAQTSLDEIEKRKASVEAETQARKKEAEDIEKEVSRCTELEKECSEKITGFTNSVSGYMIRVSSKAQKAQEHKLKTDKAALDLEQKKNRVRLLRDMEKNMEGYQGSVKAVMKEASHGQLKGIHGTLSRLISVPDTYSLAVETALGAAIQNIVTDSEEDAKKAMLYLKRNNLGRATFYPLSTVKGRELNEKGLENCGGYINVAADIVECDKKYRSVIESLLGKTVIAEDTDSAVEIGRRYSHRFKIVTLDGQVINAGGSMTGGSKIQHSGFLSRANEIERLDSQIKSDTLSLEKMEEEYKRLNEEYDSDNAALEGVKGDLIRAQEERMKLRSSLELAKSKLTIAQNAISALSDETLSSEERIKYFFEIKTKALADGEIAEKEIAEQNLRLESLTGSRRSLAEERDRVGEKVNAVNIEIASAQRDIENQRKQIEDLNSRKDGQFDRIEKLNAELKENEEKSASLAKRIEELTEKAQELRKQRDEAKAQVDSLIVKREMFEKQSGELRAKERGKTEEKERLSSELVRLEEKKNALAKEQEDTQTKLYEEYKLSKREAQELDIVIESRAEANKQLSLVKNKIKALGSVNVGAIDEYREVSEKYRFMKEQVEDVEKSKAELIKLIYGLTDKMAIQFREKFDIINENFRKTFVELFGGGKAELILEDDKDILECGIDIKAQPPGKNVKSLTLLSGGEKGLCAIALLFSILRVTPAPFCIFDEVEAALDDVNVLRYARYLKNLTAQTQYILITHRRGTMEEADILYGVTMQEKGVSKLLQLKTAQMAHDLGLE